MAKRHRFRPDSPGYQIFMLGLCLFAVFGLAAQTAGRLNPQTALILDYADNAICALFLLDFVLSLRRAPNRLRYLITWGWLDLASSIPTVSVLRWGRIARVARIFRVLRGGLDPISWTLFQ
jgi:voltage-gated potassium channel